MKTLLSAVRACEVCASALPLGPNPIIAAHPKTKIAIVSQAPGSIAHRSGVPWDDSGGKELKRWLDVDDVVFYDPKNFAIVPMGFCYPGKGKSGDLPPRPECAPLWQQKVFDQMPSLKLILLIGQYSQNYYLSTNMEKNLTETVRHFDNYLPTYFPLPHPSPRNRFWRSKNPWFDTEIIPQLQNTVKKILNY